MIPQILVRVCRDAFPEGKLVRADPRKDGKKVTDEGCIHRTRRGKIKWGKTRQTGPQQKEGNNTAMRK